MAWKTLANQPRSEIIYDCRCFAQPDQPVHRPMFTQGPVSIYKSGCASGGKWWRTIFADGGLKSPPPVMSLESYRNTITAFRDVSVSMSYWYREADRPVSPVISRSLPFHPMLPFSRTIINYHPIVFSIGVYCPLTQSLRGLDKKSVRTDRWLAALQRSRDFLRFPLW